MLHWAKHTHIHISMKPERFFKALADRTRLQCLLLLRDDRELCVCEFVHALALPQPRISRHLGSLRDQGIVSDERRGQWVYYRLSADLPDWAREVLEAVAPVHSLGDLNERLASMPNRPQVACD